MLSHKAILSYKVTLSHKVSRVSHKVGLSHKVVLSWRALWRSAHGCEQASNHGLWSTTTLARVPDAQAQAKKLHHPLQSLRHHQAQNQPLCLFNQKVVTAPNGQHHSSILEKEKIETH